MLSMSETKAAFQRANLAGLRKLAAVFILAQASLGLEARNEALAEVKQPAIPAVQCCAFADLLFCKSFLACNPLSELIESRKKFAHRFSERAVLIYDQSFLLNRDNLHSNWMPATSMPTAAARSAGLTKPSTTRAGLIIDNEVEPEFPIIRQGQAVWSADLGGEAQLVRVSIQIDTADLRVNLAFKVDSTSKILAIELVASAPKMEGRLALTEMPRARRSGATEGEPLLGRIALTTAGADRVELSPDPIDLANNQRRILSAPWLDFRLVDRNNKAVVLTVEKGKASTEMLAALLKNFMSK
jgi:hypothetical protein